MSSFLRNTISKLYNAVSAPVAATRDALAETLQGIREIASLLYTKMMVDVEYGLERLKNIVEKEAEKEAKVQQQEEKEVPSAAAKEQQQDDDEQYDTVGKIKFVYEGKPVKEFRLTRNSNRPNTKMIMNNTTPHTGMRTKSIYSFKSEINRAGGVIKGYYKTLTSPPGMFTCLGEIQAYIENVNKNGWSWITKKHSQRLIYPPKEQPRHEAIMKAK